MDFRYQRAGSVDHFEIARLGFLADGRGDAVGAENNTRAFGHFAQLFNENGAGLAQFVDHVAVVDDFFTNIYGSAVKIEDNLNHIDRAHYSRAESARTKQDYLFRRTNFPTRAHAEHYSSHVQS